LGDCLIALLAGEESEDQKAAAFVIADLALKEGEKKAE
jgi:hypothetical protein